MARIDIFRELALFGFADSEQRFCEGQCANDFANRKTFASFGTAANRWHRPVLQEADTCFEPPLDGGTFGIYG